MRLEFFDVNFCAGRSKKGFYRPSASREEAEAEIDRLGIGKALVWHIAQCDYSAGAGNSLVNGFVENSRSLLGVWTILPPQAREQENARVFFGEMKKNRIFGLRAFPAKHRFLLNRTVFGGFLDEVSERKIPLFFSVARKDAAWEGLYGLLADYPNLVLVVCSTGIWGADRYFRPLLERYPNVHLETSQVSLGDGVLEALVRDYGPARLLFGSGFPELLPESAMLQLIHAGIEQDDKKAIASGNAVRLLNRVAL